MFERRPVLRAQMLERTVGVGIALKVGEESAGAWITAAHESDAAESFKPAASDVLTLRVDSSGQCFLKDRALAADEMKIMLQEFRSSRPDASVMLETPNDLKAAQLVEIMRVLKSAGIRHSAVQPVRP